MDSLFRGHPLTLAQASYNQIATQIIKKQNKLPSLGSSSRAEWYNEFQKKKIASLFRGHPLALAQTSYSQLASQKT